MLLLIMAPLFAQVKQDTAALRHIKKLKQFSKLVKDAGGVFEYPAGFREIHAPDNEDFSFDYALELPAKGFELWLKVTSQKQEWTNFTRTQTSRGPGMENPDSVYLDVGKAMAKSLAGDQPYYERTIPPDVLARYNANAGNHTCCPCWTCLTPNIINTPC